MSERSPMPAGAGRVAIEGELTVRHAAAVREQLLAALRGNQEVHLDLTGVSELDSAGVQLLLAAGESAVAAGKVLRLSGFSRPVIDVLELLGLTDTVAGEQRREPDHESR